MQLIPSDRPQLQTTTPLLLGSTRLVAVCNCAVVPTRWLTTLTTINEQSLIESVPLTEVAISVPIAVVIGTNAHNNYRGRDDNDHVVAVVCMGRYARHSSTDFDDLFQHFHVLDQHHDGCVVRC